jgi:hypothetical protein
VRLHKYAGDASDPVDERETDEPAESHHEAANQQPTVGQFLRHVGRENHRGNCDRERGNRAGTNARQHLSVKRRETVGVDDPVRGSRHNQGDVRENDRNGEPDDGGFQGAAVLQPCRHSRRAY